MRVLHEHGTFLLAVARRAAVLAPLLSLFLMFPVFAEEQPAVAYDTLVIVDFPSPSCSGFWPVLKSELERSVRPKLLTGSARWITRDEFQKGMEFKRGYEILLRGDCRMAAPSSSQEQPRGPLGWVSMVNEQIQPFVYVDCDRVRQMLYRDLRDKTTAERRRILARAISRIVVHEMTHIVTQSSLHDASGLQKGQVTSSDLLACKTD
jgi:hypothetical protein